MLNEIKVRSFIKPQGFKKIKAYLSRQGKLLIKESQESNVLSCQRGRLYVLASDVEFKLVYKLPAYTQGEGSIMEVLGQASDADDLLEILHILKFKVICRYQKKIQVWRWRGLAVTLENVRGFGLIIKLSKLVDGRFSQSAQKKLRQQLCELLARYNLPITPITEFNKQHRIYQKDWHRLIKKPFISV
ncbi:MAG: hypothetical protein ACKKL5_01500 [Candidatus Komeilibacteria bacterium]